MEWRCFTCWYYCWALCYGFLIYCTNGLQINLGDCPVYFDEPCQSHTIRFMLFTRFGYRTTVHLLDPFYPVLPRYFNRSTPMKILVHGYGGLPIDVAIKNVSKAYQQIGHNVILVDWSSLSSLPCYATAFLNTWHVGQCIAVLVASLLPLGITPDMLHLIGFSLGAHVAAFASNHLQKVLGVPVRRITGLDPALPFFATLKNEWKLDPSDATFVDIIHTSAGSFGKIEAAGHVDFYVNGGIMQPACEHFRYPPLCSHVMAGVYFAESVRSKNFVGIYCENMAFYYIGLCRFSKAKLAIMGEHVDPMTSGIFLVETASSAPFGLGPLYYHYFR